MAISDPKKRPSDRVMARRYMVTAVIAVGVLGIGGYTYWRFRTVGTPVMPLRLGEYEPGEILIRAITNNADDLLIGILKNEDEPSVMSGRVDPVPTGQVYRFVPNSYQLEAATLDDWKAATGPITYKYLDRNRTEVLRHDKTPLRIAGGYHLDRDVSPDRKYINVVSANGPIGKGNFMFFFGGGGGVYPRGPIYHEIFDRKSGAKVGETHTLKQPSERISLSLCWEASGKYVVFHDMFGRFLWVVPGPNSSSAKAKPNQATLANSTKNVEKNHD